MPILFQSALDVLGLVWMGAEGCASFNFPESFADVIFLELDASNGPGLSNWYPSHPKVPTCIRLSYLFVRLIMFAPIPQRRYSRTWFRFYASLDT